MSVLLLKQQLAPYLPDDTDLEALYSEFQTQEKTDDIELFLSYLLDKKLLSVSGFQTLHTQFDIELTTLSLEEGDEDFYYEKPSEPHFLLGKIGEGAMGQIHLARETDLQRKVAFKTLHEKVSGDEDILAAFLNEVQITAQLDHPNIVPIYSLEKTEDKSLAYSMKLVQGQTLKDVVTQAKTSYKKGEKIAEEATLSNLLDLFINLCDAVYFAHSKGIIHRDLKPSNVMLGPYNELYLMDWGIARPMGGLETQAVELWQDKWPSEEGKVIGTPRYMSPEQILAMNEKLDGRSDQFAMGAILFELVCMKTAFRGKNYMQVLQRILKGQQEPIEHAFGTYKVPKELKAIIKKSMATKKEERYATVEDMANDIRRYQRGEAVLAKNDTPLQSLLRWLNKKQQWVLSLLLILVLISASLAVRNQYQQQQTMLASRAREKQVNQWMTRVFHQSQKIDTHFIRVEQALESLSESVKYFLINGALSTDPIHLRTQFLPPDLVKSPYYNLQISPNWIITIPSYNAEFSDFETELKKTSPVRHHLRRMFSQDFAHPHLLNTKEQRHRIIQDGGPMMWATIVLKQGVSLGYPGTDFKGDFDGRQRPYYTLAAHKKGKHWGNPYVDVTGRGLMLPCATSIYDHQGEFMGVVAVDSIFDYIIDQLLVFPDTSGRVKKVYLIDNQGQVVIDSSEKAKFKNDKSKAYTDFTLHPFPNPKIISAIKEKQSGVLDLSKDKRLLIYYRMNTIGWYYLVEVDIQT